MTNLNILVANPTQLTELITIACKYGLSFSVDAETKPTPKPITPKASKPTPTAKAVEKKPTSEKSNKLCTHDYIFTLNLGSDGYVTISTNSGHSSGAWVLASKTLLENGFTRPQGDKAHYMIAGKNGKVSKNLTKQAYDGYTDHQITISAKAINEYNAERYGRA